MSTHDFVWGGSVTAILSVGAGWLPNADANVNVDGKKQISRELVRCYDPIKKDENLPELVETGVERASKGTEGERVSQQNGK